MANYKAYDYAQAMMVPVSLGDQLEPGTLEHTIHYVVQERVDLCAFDQQRRNDETGRPGYDPRVLLRARYALISDACPRSGTRERWLMSRRSVRRTTKSSRLADVAALGTATLTSKTRAISA